MVIYFSETKILARFYASKKDPTDCDSKKPLGATKLVSECIPSDKEQSRSSSKTETNKGRTITPTECKQKKEEVPIYDKDCKRPHLETCLPQDPRHAQPECRPGGSKVPPRINECGKHSLMDELPKPGSWQEDYKKSQRNFNIFLILGALFAAGSLYQVR